MKYIIVTGGVISGLGKGITAASIGRILKNKGYNVTAVKIDPYINIDAGTIHPLQHGEVFVLKDGSEVDLDLGHYERFLDTELMSEHDITTGKVYKAIIERERRGDYLGNTVQIIPHITNEIKERIREVAKKSGADICLVEIGGTVGDIESMPFLEAMRQMHSEEGERDILFVHVTLVPLDKMGEQKTKPTQHSVKMLRGLGLSPDAIVARCKGPLLPKTKEKISLFCDVPREAVVSAHDAEDIHMVPLLLEDENLDEYLMKKLHLKPKRDGEKWHEMVEKMATLEKKVKVALIGKYTEAEDAYLSIKEALKHAGIENGCIVDIVWIGAESLEKNSKAVKHLKEVDGILVPGDDGKGAKGKMKAIQYAREHNIPFFGPSLGMQLAVIEFARNVVGLKDANSSELAQTEYPVIDLLPEQADVEEMSGTMRLGNYEAILKKGSLAHKIYGKMKIVERHRHRYEVNPKYIDVIEAKGMIFSGRNKNRMEIAEIPSQRFFFASQFYPEYTSRPERASPPFRAFVRAMLKK